VTLEEKGKLKYRPDLPGFQNLTGLRRKVGTSFFSIDMRSL